MRADTCSITRLIYWNMADETIKRIQKTELETMTAEKLIIEGTRHDGSKFRPSDWVERISSMWAEFGINHRLTYSPKVQPCIIQGQMCLVIEKSLEESNPGAYQYIMRFAQDNNLRIQPDRRTTDIPISHDRREEAGAPSN